MNSNPTPFILVIGGTGTQGGNVARELLRHGHRVRVLTRNPTSTEAQQIAAQGADVVKGDLGNLASLLPAMKTITGIFSVPYADPYDRSVELRYARNMVQAAQEMRIGQIVHTSAAGTNLFPRWTKYPELTAHLDQKYAVEELIRKGSFPNWTILHPCWFMENFAGPLAHFMAPELKEGKLFGIMHPHTPLKLNSGSDTAQLARMAFEEPGRFQARDLNIAAEECSWTQIADALSRGLHKRVTYEQVTPEQAVERGLLEGTVQAMEWLEATGYGFHLAETRQYGIPLKSFQQWVDENKHRIGVE